MNRGKREEGSGILIKTIRQTYRKEVIIRNNKTYKQTDGHRRQRKMYKDNKTDRQKGQRKVN